MTDITTERGERVLEGTWDEILAHAAEYSGKRVRVTLLPSPEAEAGARPLDEALRPILERAGQLVQEPPARRTDPQESALEDMIVAKRQRGRL